MLKNRFVKGGLLFMNAKQIENFNYLVTDEGDVISMKLNKPICKWVDNVGYYQVVLRKKWKEML